jgi:hypothetical protein
MRRTVSGKNRTATNFLTRYFQTFFILFFRYPMTQMSMTEIEYSISLMLTRWKLDKTQWRKKFSFYIDKSSWWMKHRMEAKPFSDKTSSSGEEKFFYICFDFITFSFLNNYSATVSFKIKLCLKKTWRKKNTVHHQLMQVLTEGSKLSTVIKTLPTCFFHSPSLF